MIIICEGPDNVGKGTQIIKIKRHLEEQGKLVHVLHYSNIKGDNIEQRSHQYYWEMFDFIKFSIFNNRSLILDRAHGGETVYSPIYRNYSGDYVYELESKFGNTILSNCLLIVFTANPETLIQRDDGLSFTVELMKKQKEIDLFKLFYEKSHIKNKCYIDITGKNPDEVFEEIKCHIQKMLNI